MESHGNHTEVLAAFAAHGESQTPSLPVPDPANDATREKQIPFSKQFA